MAAVAALAIGFVQPAVAHAASAPGVPGNVTATATSMSNIHITWSAVSGATSYVVSNGNISTGNLTKTSYDWGALAQGTYMCLTVTAKNSAGQSPWSPYACATTQVAPPANLKATASSTKIHISWSDTSGGAAQFVVSNGDASSPTIPAGTTSYDWTGLAVGTYMCFTVTAKQGNGQSPWIPYACATTTTGNTATDSLITSLQSAQPISLRFGMTDANGQSMDTAKIIQANGTYYAVYSPHSKSVILASAPTLYSTWTPLVTLDDNNASQPYLAQQGNGFVLADEYVNGGQSSVKFIHYASPAELEHGQSDNTYQTQLSLFGPLGVQCHEGTPDIHSTDPNNIQVGLHYDSTCDDLPGQANNQLDREAFGTLTNFSSWTTSADTARDAALTSAGFPGKHGGRDDISWMGARYSIGEAKNAVDNSDVFTSWRLTLYDYSNHTAYPVVLGIQSSCVANPKATRLTDNTDGTTVLVVTAFIFSESKPGCAAPGENGEVMYVIPAQ
ncbi:MAG: fibronectin type III domain-containing protein [Streptosporangiaceae bacterium]|nr:fibronectin type III domain-containing protein [Streptosporangiaceae bacterium]